MQKGAKDSTSRKSLACVFDDVAVQLDAVVGQTITLLEKAKQHSLAITANDNIHPGLRQLDESAFGLRGWANDLTYRDFVSKSGSIKMRDLSTRDILKIIDVGRSPVAERLRGIFDRLETNLLSISQIFESVLQCRQDEWYVQVIAQVTSAFRLILFSAQGLSFNRVECGSYAH